MTRQENSRVEVAEMRFFRAVAGYKLVDRKCNEDIRQESHYTHCCQVNKNQEKWYDYLGRRKETRLPKTTLNYKSNGRPAMRWGQQSALKPERAEGCGL
jgi:hypothetical protein